MMLQKPYELLVFDWDGTLMNSCQHIVECLQAAITDLDWQQQDGEVLQQYIGCGMFKLVTELFPDRKEVEQKQLIEQYRQHFFADPHQETLFDGVVDTLQQLAEQNYTLAVATGKGRRGLDLALEHSGLKDLFVTTRTADDGFAKPHPQILEDIMQEVGIANHATLMIGDTEFDMQLALNAKVSAVAISCGVHDEERLQRCKPLVILPSVNKLPTWLAKYALA